MGYDKTRRPQLLEEHRITKVATSTAASTALAARGAQALRSTSTGGPVVYTLSKVPKAGDELVVHANLVGATSAGAGFHVNAAAGSFFGSSSEDMLTMLGQGDAVHLRALSTDRWAIIGSFGAVSVSSST